MATNEEELFWREMRAFTQARIGLGRSGTALPTKALLAFDLAAARARDAVHTPFDPATIAKQAAGLDCLPVESRAPDRAVYLRRPDLGRRLSASSAELLTERAGGTGPDLVFVIADGLSAAAAGSHAIPVVRACLSGLRDLTIGPLVVARQARVALADEVGEIMAARLVVILLGERPGLAVANSLGLYLTWAPRIGTPDSQRNCLSNIHAAGLAPETAAHIATWLIREAFRLRLSGIRLKEDASVRSVLAEVVPTSLLT